MDLATKTDVLPSVRLKVSPWALESPASTALDKNFDAVLSRVSDVSIGRESESKSTAVSTTKASSSESVNLGAAMARDEDTDLRLMGVTMLGAEEGDESGGSTILRFPPNGASDNIKRAWAEATVGMNEGDAATLGLMMLPEVSIVGGSVETPVVHMNGVGEYITWSSAQIENIQFYMQVVPGYQRALYEKYIDVIDRFMALIE